MAHFRGILQGSRGQASRLGTKNSGLRVEAQSWQGKIVVTLEHHEASGKDLVRVTKQQHHGAGGYVELYAGEVGCE